uniref:Uncharacterized protein n=1 Tax=Rhizophagus irregularis (strain DAOM 181602 / DAOM 197198 / MUCL 43194) TaxID=747089 RepID=U9UDH5_RHIID
MSYRWDILLEISSGRSLKKLNLDPKNYFVYFWIAVMMEKDDKGGNCGDGGDGGGGGA